MGRSGSLSPADCCSPQSTGPEQFPAALLSDTFVSATYTYIITVNQIPDVPHKILQPVDDSFN